MTREEAIGHLRVIITYAENDGYTELAIEALKMAIKALEQESILDKIEKEINSPNRGTCDYFIVDRIEEIINKYKAESEEGAKK